MSWLTFTDEDRTLANAFRFARLVMCIPTLQQAILRIDPKNTLHIHTQNPTDLASLQLFSHDLQYQVYIVLGCREVHLWDDRDLVEQYSLESIEDVIEHSQLIMSTATLTLDRPAAYNASSDSQTSAVADKTSLPGQTLAAVAEDTEQDINEIRDWCRDQGWPVIPFGDSEVISGEAALAALDWFGQILIQQRKAKRGLMIGAITSSEPSEPTFNGTAPESDASAEAPTLDKEPKNIRALALASSFKSKVVKNNARVNLMRALPAKPEAQAEYLNEIVSGSERGTLFLEKVAATIMDKFGGDQSKLIESLRKSAKNIQANREAKAS